jgi:hypothetical protein
MFMLMEKSIVDDNSLIYICHERVSHARKVPEQSPAPCIKLPGALQTVASSSFQALSLSITGSTATASSTGWPTLASGHRVLAGGHE